LLKRYKQSTRKSFIIPDIPKIINLLDKRDLNNLVKTIESSKESYGAMNLKEILTGPPMRYCTFTFTANDEDYIRKSTAVYTSNSLNIYTVCPEEKSFHLKDDDIQQLVFLGESIALRDKSMPCKVIIEYKGDMHSSEKEELS
jgi:hypothetical protein